MLALALSAVAGAHTAGMPAHLPLPPSTNLTSLSLNAGAQKPSGKSGPDVWGVAGERWDREVLLDWSWSGYAAKERPYPDPPFVANVLDFGAVGDGKYDNVGPFRAAIEAARVAGGGTILIPEGKYMVSKRLWINGHGIVLRGAGPNATTILFPESLAELDNVDIADFNESPYSWLDGWLQIAGDDAGSTNRDTLRGTVVASAEMGDRALTLSSTAGIEAGQWVRLLLSDADGALVNAMYGSIIDRVGCDEGCIDRLTGETDMVRWAVRVVAVDGNTIILQRALPLPVGPGAEIHAVPDSMIREAGIRDLRIEFPWTPAPPHLKEKGHNAIYVHGAINAFVLNVETINVDVGVMVAYSNYVSVDKVRVGVTKPRGQSLPFDGHIALGSYEAADVEFGNFDIDGEWTHDVTVRGTLMVVAHNGRGNNLNLDSHRSAPYATLYSNLHMGRATRPYGTGGYMSRGFPAGRYTTYYNLKTAAGSVLSVPAGTMAGPCTWGSGINALGYWTDTTCPGYHVESFQYGSLQPADLYGSQIDRKFSQRVAGTADVPLPAQTEGAGLKDGESGPYPAGDGTYPAIAAPEVY